MMDNTQIKWEIGDSLVEIRTTLNMNATQFSETCEISLLNYVLWESGKIDAVSHGEEFKKMLLYIKNHYLNNVKIALNYNKILTLYQKIK